MKKVVKNIMKVLFSIFFILVGIALIFITVIFLNSPGKLSGVVTGKNSIEEKVFIEINGIEQGMFLVGEDINNPVILLLHGGPGSPEESSVLANEGIERLEKYFTVCYWNQRGSGITYQNENFLGNDPLKTMVKDTVEVTKYLQKRFNQEKIILMGHSWGSYLGVKTIERAPELYLAYVGTGQVTNQRESEILAYDYILNHAKEILDSGAVKKLEKINVNAKDFPDINYIITTRTDLMNKYGVGIEHENYSMWKTWKEIFFFKGYSFSEKVKFIQGSVFSLNNIFYLVTEDDLFDSSTNFEVPFYIIHGKYDYQVSYELAKEYFETITAPKKEFVTFENSAHSPIFEDNEKFTETVLQIYNDNK